MVGRTLKFQGVVFGPGISVLSHAFFLFAGITLD